MCVYVVIQSKKDQLKARAQTAKVSTKINDVSVFLLTCTRQRCFEVALANTFSSPST